MRARFAEVKGREFLHVLRCNCLSVIMTESFIYLAGDQTASVVRKPFSIVLLVVLRKTLIAALYFGHEMEEWVLTSRHMLTRPKLRKWQLCTA